MWPPDPPNHISNYLFYVRTFGNVICDQCPFLLCGLNVKIVAVFATVFIFILFYLFTIYSFNPATWGHSPKDIEHVKIRVT